MPPTNDERSSARLMAGVEATPAAAAESVPLTLVADSRTDGRERYGHALVLVRPDQFVAWAADDAPADPRALLRKIAGG